MDEGNGAKVKIQDIADRAGLSRNTVSKIFNGKYRGSQEVKEKVLALAVEMKYKEYGQLDGMNFDALKAAVNQEVPNKNILVLSKGDIVSSNFFAHIINEIQKKIEGAGYTLMLVNVSESDIEQLVIPSAVNRDMADGMICMEMFNKGYIELLLSTQIPAVFVEFYYKPWAIKGNFDVVMMNNAYHVYHCVESLIQAGCKRIGYIGDYTHCLGFHERYKAYVEAIREHQIAISPMESFTMKDGHEYFDVDWIMEKMQSEKRIPDAYICANDAIAINFLHALNRLGYQVPDDVQMVSFDDIPDAVMVKPSLTTIRIFREDLGKTAIDCLLERMAFPSKRQQIVYVETELVERETTKKGIFRYE